MPPEDPERRLNIRLSEDEHRRARIAAAARGISLNEFGLQALRMKVPKIGAFDPECELFSTHVVGNTCAVCGGRGTPSDGRWRRKLSDTELGLAATGVLCVGCHGPAHELIHAIVHGISL